MQLRYFYSETKKPNYLQFPTQCFENYSNSCKYIVIYDSLNLPRRLYRDANRKSRKEATEDVC